MGIDLGSKYKDNYENYYVDGSSEWRRIGAIDKANKIIDLCSDLPHRSILEIGAGEGSILEKLSREGFGDELYAIEISSSGVQAIIDKSIDKLAECKSFDGYNIPYDENKFDLAILSHVIEHVEHPRRLIYEAKRVAKYVFVEVPLEDTIRLNNNFHFDPVGHINFFSKNTIRLLLQSCDLKIIDSVVYNPSKSMYTFHRNNFGFIKYYIKELLLKFFPTVATKVFTYHFSLVCWSSELDSMSSNSYDINNEHHAEISNI